MSEKPAPPKVVDVFTRQEVTRAESNKPSKADIFLQSWRRMCRKTNVQSVFIVTIDENDYLDFGYMSENDYHKALAALALEDMRQDIKNDIFEEFEFEEDGDDDAG